jgi:predicted RNA-binding protein with PUA-like domain
MGLLPSTTDPPNTERENTDTVAKKTAGGWLFKEEPDHFSYADLERDGEARWDGVTNSLARMNLRQLKPGDRVLFYHTGKEKAIVGEMRVVAGPAADTMSDDPKAVFVTVEPVRRWKRPLGLQRIKADPELAGWDLIRLPRLSVVAVSAAQWRRLEELSEADP